LCLRSLQTQGGDFDFLSPPRLPSVLSSAPSIATQSPPLLQSQKIVAETVPRPILRTPGAGPPFPSSQLPRVPRPCVCVLCRHRAGILTSYPHRGSKVSPMTPDVSELLKKALALPPEARAALAGSLLESLDDTVDSSAEEEWSREIARRIEELDSGKVKPVPWAEARRQISAFLPS
jgi:putative addiction module component (TIGR02574 family)